MAEPEEQEGRITLAMLVARLREELLAAQEAATGEDLRLELMEATVEVQVAMSTEWGEKGKVGFWVLTGEMSDTERKSQSQKITLKLKPKPGKGHGSFEVKDVVPG